MKSPHYSGRHAENRSRHQNDRVRSRYERPQTYRRTHVSPIRRRDENYRTHSTFDERMREKERRIRDRHRSENRRRPSRSRSKGERSNRSKPSSQNERKKKKEKKHSEKHSCFQGASVDEVCARPGRAGHTFECSIKQCIFCKKTTTTKELHLFRSLIASYIEMKRGKLKLEEAREIMSKAKRGQRVFTCLDCLKAGGRRMKSLFPVNFDSPAGKVPSESFILVYQEMSQIGKGILKMPQPAQVITRITAYWTFYLEIENHKETKGNRMNFPYQGNADPDNNGINFWIRSKPQNPETASSSSIIRKRQLLVETSDSPHPGPSTSNKRFCQSTKQGLDPNSALEDSKTARRKPMEKFQLASSSQQSKINTPSESGITVGKFWPSRPLNIITETMSDVLKNEYAEFRSTSRNISSYRQLKLLDCGTYGTVYEAMDKKTGRLVAIKSLRESPVHNYCTYCLRKVQWMQLIGDHPNIVQFIEGVTNGVNNNVYFAMELLDTNLNTVIREMSKKEQLLDPATIKRYMLHLLQGLDYLHSKDIIHLDIKPGNLLISEPQGSLSSLKIGDLGSSLHGTLYLPQGMQTLPYRSPEMLMDLPYNNKVDVWSAGCVFSAMLKNTEIFSAENEQQTLQKIFEKAGTPNRYTWKEFNIHEKKIRSKFNFSHDFHQSDIIGVFSSTAMNYAGLKLIDGLLKLCPHRRLTCQQALSSEYFQ